MRCAHPDEVTWFLMIDGAGDADVRVLLRDLLVAQDGRRDLPGARSRALGADGGAGAAQHRSITEHANYQ
jgi:hypothetical protein